MAKKKQFTGKQTKLARLPLTRALAGQGDAQATWDPPAAEPPRLGETSPLPADRPVAPADRIAAADGSLAAAYLYLLQELTALRSQLNAQAALIPRELPRPENFLKTGRMKQAVLLTRRSLYDLYQFLS